MCNKTIVLLLRLSKYFQTSEQSTPQYYTKWKSLKPFTHFHMLPVSLFVFALHDIHPPGQHATRSAPAHSPLLGPVPPRTTWSSPPPSGAQAPDKPLRNRERDQLDGRSLSTHHRIRERDQLIDGLSLCQDPGRAENPRPGLVIINVDVLSIDRVIPQWTAAVRGNAVVYGSMNQWNSLVNVWCRMSYYFRPRPHSKR